jgi:hypothetical protein
MKSREGRSWIFDPIRKKYIVLTPEEWVRQNFLQYLVQDQGYPGSLITVEREFLFNRMKKRTDILVYNRNAEPVFLVECKAPDVAVDPSVFEQIGLYNLSYRVPWLAVTNGMKHYCCFYEPESGKYAFADRIPDWTEVSG